MLWQANPDEETTDWRAVCGRTARTVRRAGTAKAVSGPYQERGRQSCWKRLDARLRGHDGLAIRVGGKPATIAVWKKNLPLLRFPCGGGTFRVREVVR